MYMKNQLLRDTDLFGMANSLEIRVPFLDKELVDYILRVEPKEKFGIYRASCRNYDYFSKIVFAQLSFLSCFF